MTGSTGPLGTGPTGPTGTVIDVNNKLAASLVSYNDTTLDIEVGNKAPIANPTFTGTVGGITKSMVGLANVDNTTDADKPVSTATQTALDAKLNLSGGTLTGGLSSNSDITLTGSAKIKYPSGTAGNVLTSDATGNLTLQALAGSSITFRNNPTWVRATGTVFTLTLNTPVKVGDMAIPQGTWLILCQFSLSLASGSITSTSTRLSVSRANSIPQIYCNQELTNGGSNGQWPSISTVVTIGGAGETHNLFIQIGASASNTPVWMADDKTRSFIAIKLA
jgi:hypothetical protein